jgi:signal transduction histidine kinase
MTGYGTLSAAQDSMLRGANQYLKKPTDVKELVAAVRRQCEATKLRRRQTEIYRQTRLNNAALKHELEQAAPQIWQGRASVELVHDLTNPLMVTIGYATLVVEEAKLLADLNPERSHKLLAYCEMVNKAAEYAHHLAEHWRQAAEHSSELESLDLVTVIKEVSSVIFFDNPAVHVTGLESAMVRGLKFQLMRVFQNLIKNALEAGSTRITVDVAMVDNFLEVTVSDNGKGMTPEVCEKIKQGFYTNKEHGLGLGLKICHHVLKSHGASLVIKSNDGHGTVALIRFNLTR